MVLQPPWRGKFPYTSRSLGRIRGIPKSCITRGGRPQRVKVPEVGGVTTQLYREIGFKGLIRMSIALWGYHFIVRLYNFILEERKNRKYRLRIMEDLKSRRGLGGSIFICYLC